MFKQRKNKRFYYNLRFQENRKDNVNQDSLESKWNNLKQTQKQRKHFLRGLPFLVFALAALIVLILILNSYE
ncbi:MAG: hypothetical protein KJO22_10940 [Bacteroidia bacterium]|nr:hypothetical protein [Bacteroidia bacterium]